MTHVAHGHMRIAPPDAPFGSLLEMIQLAQYRCTGTPESYAASSERRRCLRAAKTHRALLSEVLARDGLRSYIEHCPTPWIGLWPQVERVIGGKP